MKLLYTTADGSDTGEVLPVPAAWKKCCVPWATMMEYRQYRSFASLIQEWKASGFSIYIWRVLTHSPILMYAVCGQPTLALQFTLEGTIPCGFQGFGKKLLEQGKYELFYVATSTNEAFFESGTYESLHFEIQPSFLEDVSEQYPKLSELLQRLKISSEEGKPFVAFSFNYIVKAILGNMRQCKATGGELRLDMDKYLLELLSQYLKQLHEKDSEQSLPWVAHKAVLLQIRGEILHAPDIHTKTIALLARKAGLSETALKKNFAALFSEPIASFVRRHALNKAHYLLQTTMRDIEDIADEVGYSSFTNFSKPFRKQFGYTPHQLRGGIPP